jgi:zinc and cadmium transporter
MSFVSGLMLGVAFYHLLPHSVAMLGGHGAADTAVQWLMGGLITMLLLLRLFHFHQHDFSDEEENLFEHHDHHDHHDHHEHHEHSHAAPLHRMSWLGIALGLGLHTLIDGIALGAAMQVEIAGGGVGLVGVGVFLAVLLHKPLDAMSITTIMAGGGWSRRARTATNLAFALLCPLGALVFFFGLDLVGHSSDYLVAAALAFSAGTFICIALSDLLPEVHFHSHDRTKLTLAFLLGIGLAYAIGALEPANFHLSHP